MKKSALFLAIGGVFLGMIFGYLAISGELTGKTLFFDEQAHPGSSIRNRGGFVSVSRGGSPVEFRRGNNLFWALGGFGIIVAGIGIYFFREIDSND